MTEAIFPALFRFSSVRQMVLGKYFIEGTWLQAERGAPEGPRLSVIDIQPSGNGFIFSGYALNSSLEVESNTLIEFSRFDWPFMTYKYRNSLSDGGDGQREGVGEIQFEMNASAAVRYNGFAQFVKNGRRVKIDGAKLTKSREVRRLRTLDGRRDVLEKYWNLFFSTTLRLDAIAEQSVASKVKKASKEEAAFADRRKADEIREEAGIVQRRRAADWRQDDETPVAKRAREELTRNEAPKAEATIMPLAKPEPAPSILDTPDTSEEYSLSDIMGSIEPESAGDTAEAAEFESEDVTIPKMRRRVVRAS
jgi:hypothetical protein